MRLLIHESMGGNLGTYLCRAIVKPSSGREAHKEEVPDDAYEPIAISKFEGPAEFALIHALELAAVIIDEAQLQK